MPRTLLARNVHPRELQRKASSCDSFAHTHQISEPPQTYSSEASYSLPTWHQSKPSITKVVASRGPINDLCLPRPFSQNPKRDSAPMSRVRGTQRFALLSCRQSLDTRSSPPIRGCHVCAVFEKPGRGYC